jgi:hypothetical protein
MWWWLSIRWKASSLSYGKTPNLPLTYLSINLFTASLLLVISNFYYEPEIWSTNRKHGDKDLAELVTTMFWVAPGDERTERNSLPELSLEFGRKSNFDEMFIAAYGYEFSWRWAVVAYMATTLLRGYRGDESMVDGLRCFGDMYLYRLGGGWLYDRSNLLLIC